jgi:hypothetical protein
MRSVGKMPQRDRLALIRSTPQQHVPAGHRQLNHTTALDTKTSAPLIYASFVNPSRLYVGNYGCVSSVDWLRHRYVVLLPIPAAARFSQGNGWVRRRLRYDKANGENASP